MVERLQAQAVEEKREERQKTAHELVQRQNGRRALAAEFILESLPATPDKLQLRPQPAQGQQKNSRADQAGDMVRDRNWGWHVLHESQSARGHKFIFLPLILQAGHSALRGDGVDQAGEGVL